MQTTGTYDLNLPITFKQEEDYTKKKKEEKFNLLKKPFSVTSIGVIIFFFHSNQSVSSKMLFCFII